MDPSESRFTFEEQRFSTGFFSAAEPSSPQPPTDTAPLDHPTPTDLDLPETPVPDSPAAELDAEISADVPEPSPVIADTAPPPDEPPAPGPTLPQFFTAAPKPTHPSKNWSVSSGFWQSQTTSPPPTAPEDLVPGENEEMTGLEDLAAAALAEPFAEAPDLSVPAPSPERLHPPEVLPPIAPPAIPPEPQPIRDETLHQPHAELAQLRAENQQLYEHIAQMEELLQECQATLELQMMRSQTQESLIERQTQELEDTHQALQQTQTEADRILTELEKSGEILQRQAQELADAQQLAATLQITLEDTQREVSRYQVVVETLTQELDNSQTRIAHLEETCTQLQQRSLTQDAAIAQTEAHCQELQSRLNRQQRQTLHFRSALERCLDLGLIAELPDPEAPRPLQLPNSSIQPWSLGAAAEATSLQSAAPDDPPQNVVPDPAPLAAAAPVAEIEIPRPKKKPQENNSQAVYPSIPMVKTPPTPITLPPLGEIADAEVEEPTESQPVDVSPSDIVALLDWGLEEPIPSKPAPSPASSAFPEMIPSPEENTVETVETVKEIGAIAPPSQPAPEPVPEPVPEPETVPPVEEDPAPLKQPLSNLLSLGAELLNLQELDTSLAPTEQSGSPNHQPSAPPEPFTDPHTSSFAPQPPATEPEPTVPTTTAPKIAPDVMVASSSPKRNSLAAVELPIFPQPQSSEP